MYFKLAQFFDEVLTASQTHGMSVKLWDDMECCIITLGRAEYQCNPRTV